MSANKRIMNELGQINSDPVPGTVVSLPNEQDIFKWEAIMTGPAESVYAGGKFKLEVTLPKEYPFKPPVISFRTKIYHPNVTNDEKGSMCLGILRSDSWKPPNRIREVLALVRQILVTPQPDDSVEASIADQYKTDPKTFEKIAQEWVTKYAK
ncbi:ubiquitin-conjugating enzyme/RWD-like protein [Delphinella strobiligena]|nr:ubiquitin-conjugating enzyme/RWD-like protein [Delphinella strobiligena]